MTTKQKKKKKVLVVDTDDVCRRVIARRLSISGFDVILAADGTTALSMAREEHPDVIVSELDLPRLDGKQLCYKIRHDPATASIPVIILTYKNMLQSKLSSFTAGAVDYITKPFSLAELEARIRASSRKVQ